MYYSGDQDIWYAQCKDAIYSERSQASMEEAVKKYPMTMEYDKVVLGVVDLTPNEDKNDSAETATKPAN